MISDHTSSGFGEDGPVDRSQLANQITALFYEDHIILRYIQRHFPDLIYHEAEEVENDSFGVFYRRIIEGSIDSLENVASLQGCSHDELKGALAFVFGVARRLATVAVNKKRNHPVHELGDAGRNEVDTSSELHDFDILKFRALRLARWLFSRTQYRAMQLKRRGHSFEQIAKIQGEHDRVWIAKDLRNAYRKVATIFVASLDEDFIEMIRLKVWQGKRKEAEKNGVSTHAQSVTKYRYPGDDPSLSDVNVVAIFLERMINHASRHRTSRTSVA